VEAFLRHYKLTFFLLHVDSTDVEVNFPAISYNLQAQYCLLNLYELYKRPSWGQQVYLYIEHELAQGQKNLTCSNRTRLIIQTDFSKKTFSTCKYLSK